MVDTALIKSRISCIAYAQSIGLPIKRDGDRCVSPLRPGASNKNSFVVHTDYWHDFGSGEHGDVIDLDALLNRGGDRGKAIWELARRTGVLADDEYDRWQQATQRRCNQIATWNAALRPSDIEYLHSRRINDNTIRELRIGYNNNRIIIPYYKNGYVVSWIGRALGDGTPKYYKMPNGENPEHAPWGLHTLTRNQKQLYIAEGTFDALSLYQDGKAVLASMGGYFGAETLKQVISIAKDYEEVILTFDNDDAGLKFTEQMAARFLPLGIRVKVAVIPQPCKDISDYYVANGTTNGLETEDGAVYIATRIKDKATFKRFAFMLARRMERADVAEVFDKARSANNINATWLKELEGATRKAPPEPMIAEAVMKKHQLVYVDNVGFYEYMKYGKWQRISDQLVHAYIANELGTFTTGARLNSIKAVIKPEILYDGEFDKKPLMNFVNGTLELETGTFREHSPNDMCSIQLPYPYIEDAVAPQWEKFIWQVTAQDERKAEILQFLAGYVLFEDCPHEKIFVLTGSGGNGKSRFTMILQELYGLENVTNITPQGLTEEFQRIHLRDSLLNLAGEIRSNLAGAEEIMKQIASGERVQACYKGKDHISFTPRCKLVYSCNGQLKSTDTSDGLARRLIIVDFPCQFVDNPDPNDPYQMPKDTDLLKKLKAELSGIFNWAYKGYRQLKTIGYFTETDEQNEQMQQFKEASNPILVFCQDFEEENAQYADINRQTLYVRYRQWCEDNGHKPASNTRFHPEFTRIMKGKWEPFERTERINGGRRTIRGYENMALVEKPKDDEFAFWK